MKPERMISCWPLVFVCLLAGSQVSRAETLGEGWPFHRKLEVKAVPCDAPGDNLAWTEFYSNGAHRPDGSDFRVTTAEGVVVPLRLMQISANDDLVRLAFVTRSSGIYYVWWGNPKADRPGPIADIRRGVWCQICKFPGGELGSAERIRKAFERSGTIEGSVFVPEVFLGFNPLGDESNTMFRYRAQFHIENAATYDLAYAVDDTGYVAVDGATIIDVPNMMEQDARNHKVLDLKPGWHKLEVAQVNFGGPTSASLAWKRPGDGRFATMPRTVFAPVAEVTAGVLQKVGQPYAVDFGIELAAEAFAPPEFYLQRYQFSADNIPAGATVRWDFGDGQSLADDPRPTHYFLTPGIYSVALSVNSQGLQFKGTRRINVQDRMYARFPTPPDDPPKTVASVLEHYERRALNAEQRLRGMLYFKAQSLADAQIAWGKSWEEATEAGPEDSIWDETQDLAELCARRNDFAQAAEMYRLAAGKALAMDMKLRCLRMYAIWTCDFVGNPDEVLGVAEQWKPRLEAQKPEQNHALQVIIAYAALAKGDSKLAEKAIHDAGDTGRSFQDSKIHEGVLARNIETYIRTQDYQTAGALINQWESDRPPTMLAGFTRLLKVKLLVAEGWPLAAAQVARQLVRANPNCFYSAELLYRAAEALRGAGKDGDAATVLGILKDKYPESPYAREKVKIE